MITKNEKAKGLWWRLLATLPVLAVLLVANTKVTAQEKSADKKPITVEMGRFEIFDDDGAPMQLKDTIFYDDDGTYVKFETSDGFQPETGEPCKKLTVTSYNADGTPRNNFFITETERRGDTSTYSIEPFTFTLSEHLFDQLLGVATSDENTVLQEIKDDTTVYNISTSVYNISTTKDLKAKVTLKDADSIFQIVDEMPQFPGGEAAMMKFVANNVKYPQEARDKEIQGRVFVGFVIEKDGSVNEVKVLRSIGGGCDEEAVRVIKSMPKWKPGKQKGKPVRVSYMMPINFKLADTPSPKGLENTLYMGEGTGKKDGVTYTMKMNMEFESKTTGYFVMTLTSQKKNEIAKVDFEDVGLPFTYTFDGKSSGSIQPTNPDGGQLGDEPMPPYGFLINKDGSITVSFYDFKNDIGIEQIVFKKVVK